LSKEDEKNKPESNVLDNGKPIVRWGRKARGLKTKTAQLPKEHKMTKPLYLALLPVSLLACIEQNDNVYVEYPCVEVNIEINQDSDTNTDPDSTEDEQQEEEEFLSEDVDDNAETNFDAEEPVIEAIEEEEPAVETDQLEVEEEELDIEFEQIETEEPAVEDQLIEEEEEEEEEEQQQELELHDVQLNITADDHWEGWINGQYFGESTGFSTISQIDFELTAGHHVLAIKAKDMAYTINGLIASVDLDGASYSVTGDEQWLASKQTPSSNWILPSFNDSSWGAAQTCSASYIWNGEAESLIQDGAEWIWHNFECKKNLGTSWFRLHIIIE
jgi:hypothetical protein